MAMVARGFHRSTVVARLTSWPAPPVIDLPMIPASECAIGAAHQSDFLAHDMRPQPPTAKRSRVLVSLSPIWKLIDGKMMRALHIPRTVRQFFL